MVEKNGGRFVVVNAFSLNMLDPDRGEEVVHVIPVSEDVVRRILELHNFESAVGHTATAKFLSRKFGVDIETNRMQVKLDEDTVLVVMQVMKRLQEGVVLSDEEMEKVPVRFFLVSVGIPSSMDGYGFVISKASRVLEELAKH